MWEARIACSGPGCEAELELLIDDLRELDGVVCDCGYGYTLVAVVEVEPV